MKRVTRVAVLSLLLIAAMAVTSVIAVSAQDEDEDVLIIGFEQEPPNFRPLNTLTFGALVENFYTRDLWEWTTDREIYPVMVTEIPTVENGRVVTTEDGDTAVTMTLIEGLQWSDGEPITAVDCEVEHIIRSDPSTADGMGRGSYPDVVSDFAIAEDDPLTFTITYTGTYPDYLTATERPQCRFPAHVYGPMIEDGGKLDDDPYFTGGGDFDGALTVGYGPYVMTDWSIGSSMTFVANPYWGGDAPGFERVEVVFITDSAQMRNAMETGEIDIAYNWSDDLQPEYASIDGVETFAVPAVYTDALWIRSGEIGNDDAHGGTALQDPLVRQAIAHAIDRLTLAEALVGPGIEVPTSWYPKAIWPDDLPFLEYDPELAASLLDEAGWVLNDDGVREKDGVTLDNLRFVTTENELRNNYQIFIQDYLADVGIGVDIQIIPATNLFASFSDDGTLTNYRWDLAIFANSAEPLNPLTDRDSYTCAGIPSAENPGGFNPWQFCNERYDELQDLIESTLPGPERDALVEEAVTLKYEGYFWHGLRLRATWYAVNASIVDPATVEPHAGTLSDNYFIEVDQWQPAGG